MRWDKVSKGMMTREKAFATRNDAPRYGVITAPAHPCTDWAKKRGEFGAEVMRLGWAYNEERKKTEGDKWK